MRVPKAVRRISLRVWFVVVLILFCDISCGALADSSADLRNANDLIAVEKYDDALKVLQALPTSDVLAAPQALELIGDCYRLKLMFVEAAAAYESALSKHKLPDEQAKRIRRWLIKCHIRAREWGKVESEIEAIAAESPECAAWSYFSLGSHYRRFKNYDKAVAAFENAVPKSASVPAPDGKLVPNVWMCVTPDPNGLANCPEKTNGACGQCDTCVCKHAGGPFAYCTSTYQFSRYQVLFRHCP